MGRIYNLSTYSNTGGEYFTDAPVNQPPVATHDSYTTSLNTMLTVAALGVLANDNDPDSNPLTASVVTLPDHGTLTLSSNGGFSYVPDTGFIGNDSFLYRAFDGTAFSNEAGVSITVSGTNSTPTNTVTATASPTQTPTGTLVPLTPTASPVPPSATPTGTMTPGTATPTATTVVPSATPTATVPPSTTPTPLPPEGHSLYLPVIQG